MNNPMLDKDFLKELDRIPLKEVYAEIIALNDKDEVLESIEGYITAGTINIDGASSVRRTCTLTVVANELNIHEYYWGLRNKFKLSVGLKNDINPKYPDIIWFDQGIFIISNFTTTQGASNYTINIQGKDKMSKLNGEMGGMITGLTHDFGKILVTSKTGDTTEEDFLLKDIIIGAVHQFANEPLYNIIVNDLDDQGLELLEYKGEDPIYIIIDESTGESSNINFDGEAVYINTETGRNIKIKDIPENRYNPLFDLEKEGVVSTYLTLRDSQDNRYSVAKLTYGVTAGYRLTSLTYAGDLIMNVGETVTAMLDKIVQMLGQYEYFYDIDGKFIFQRKKTYFNSSWNNIVNNEDEQYVEPAAYSSAVSYSFEDGTIIASYQNNPNFANIKNDFAVWGTKKSVTGQELPVHMRFAIDKKPTLFVNYEGIHYTTLSEEEINKVIEDWYRGENPPFYIKKPNPNGLPEDWWDIFDWAEYYKLSTGSYPNRVMGEYLRNGGVTFTREEMYAMFPKGSKTNEHFVGRPIYLFDVEADGTLGNTGHGTGCTAHRYKDYFIDQLGARGATAYLYKPDLPIDIDGYDIPQLEIHSNLDWRELIYQMAVDYREHHDDEDYYVKISTTNYGNYDRGTTGYEQYYTDMLGFWRQLYSPEPEEVYEIVYLSKNSYVGKEKEYLYARDKYIPCEENTPYYPSAGYFIWEADENYKYSMMPVYGLTRASYYENFKTANPIQYYIIDPEEPFEIVPTSIIEPYHKEGRGYYTSAGVPMTQVSEANYTANPGNYYQIKVKELEPCAEVKKYKASITYCNSAGETYREQPTEEVYYKDPDLYFYKEFSYTRCTEDDIYDNSIVYYRQVSNPSSDEITYAAIKSINEEIFNKNKDQYYTRNPGQSIIECVTLIKKEYEEGSYYIKAVEEEEIVYNKVSIDESSYEGYWKKGNLFFEKIYYECCSHYIDYSPLVIFYQSEGNKYEDNGWLKDISLYPETLNFWFDFLDEDSELQKFGCHSIGNRPKGVNDNQVKAIYFRETPTVIFVDENLWEETDRSKLGYTYLKLPENQTPLFSLSAQGKSAKTVVDDLIYKHVCNAESITISVLPIYHLQPNTRIFVRNDESGINGEYIISRYSINLGTGNNMSISATKAVDRLY